MNFSSGTRHNKMGIGRCATTESLIRQASPSRPNGRGRYMRFKKGLLSVATLALVASLAPAASAQLIASDSYKLGTTPANGEYATASLNSTSNNGLVTTGFATGRYDQGTGSANFTAVANGLSYAATGVNFADDSGKVRWVNTALDNTNRSVARNLTNTAAATTLWIGYMVRFDSLTAIGADGFALTGFGNSVFPLLGTATGNMTGVYVGFAANANGTSANLVMRYRDAVGTATNNSDVILVNGATGQTAGTTFMVAMKVEVNVGGGSNDRVTYFVNPGDFTSESQLAATSLVTGSVNTVAFQNGSIGNSATDLVRLNYASRNWNGDVFFDEPRLGRDLASTFNVQAGGGAATPEPGTFALFGVGIIGLALRARRKSAR